MMCASRSAHHRARASAMAPRAVTTSAFPITHLNLIKSPPTPDPKNGGPTMGSPDSPPNGNSIVVSSQPTVINIPDGVNTNNLPLTSGLTKSTLPISLYLNRNGLSSVPPELLKLCHLELLNLSGNSLILLPRSSRYSLLSRKSSIYSTPTYRQSQPCSVAASTERQYTRHRKQSARQILKSIMPKDDTPAHCYDSSSCGVVVRSFFTELGYRSS